MSNVCKTITIDLYLIIIVVWERDNVYDSMIFFFDIKYSTLKWFCGCINHGISTTLESHVILFFSFSLVKWGEWKLETFINTNDKLYDIHSMDSLIHFFAEISHAKRHILYVLITWKLVVKMHPTCWCDRWN